MHLLIHDENDVTFEIKKSFRLRLFHEQFDSRKNLQEDNLKTTSFLDCAE